MVIDLDPSEVEFDQIVEVAQCVHKLLDKIGAANFCKTGLHIYVPLGAQYQFNQAKLFGEIIVRLVHQKLPVLTTLNQRLTERKGRIYLDHTRRTAFNSGIQRNYRFASSAMARGVR